MSMPALDASSDLLAWLRSSPEDWAQAAAATAESNGVTADALVSAASEAEAAALLGLTKFGAKRKLWLALKASTPAPSARDEPAAAAPASSAGSASASASSAGSASASAPAAPASAASAAPRRANPAANAADDAHSNEAFALGQVQWVGEKLEKALSSAETAAWARPQVRAAKLSELQSLRRHTGLPGVHIVVCGNTGAGKSTVRASSRPLFHTAMP
jgi:hypothetical protein